MLTKLDIVDGLSDIKVCVGYRLDGRDIDYLPAGEGAQARVEPIYEIVAGWQEPTARARSWAQLPAPAIKYVRRIEARGHHPHAQPVRELTEEILAQIE